MLQRVCVVVLGGTLTCCLGGISWLFVLSGPVWSGPAWRGCLARRLRLVGLALCVWGWLVVVLCGVGNTPACGGLLRLLWSWWSVVVGVPGACWCACVGVACCRGSGAVRPGCLARASAACWWGGVGVGGLVVNCIVDASILL